MSGAIELVCDLDGVVYRADRAIPGAGAALTALTEQGVGLTFLTNNATKTAAEAAAKITRVTGFEVKADQVVTSAEAAAHLLVETRPPTLLLGAAGAVEPLQRAGIEIVERWQEARALVVGLDPDLSYERLTEAVMAVNNGARFVATNTDVTYPTTEGLWPGAGALVAAVQAASGVEPEVVGKPHAPIRALLEDRLGGGRVMVVGDRPETDLALGVSEGWETILVLSGVTESAAGVAPPPDYIVDSIAEIPGLVDKLS